MMLSTLLFSALSAQKMVLTRYDKQPKPKEHPYINLLQRQASPFEASKSATFQRLLVILVDFPLESPDNPSTTGNGKFQLNADPNYLHTIGSPPHNRQYYEANLEAMKYYYKAVSAESYQLEYDVYPKNKQAYTLPQSMGYYNPEGADASVFLSRMEEYFKTSFELADTDDPEIDFSAYSHYMIIHAGSDWQHDVNGDSPSDLPSFFIRVGENKEAVVDGGAVRISHACNVPATISQDFSTSESKGQVVHTGYGALNAVLFHEFGHSLGFVDLYNVADFRPMVGSFDIMDSGGSSMMVDELDNGDLILIEGTLPTMPGAFSRQLVFGDYYKQAGYMQELSDLSLFSPQSLYAVSAKQTSLIKVPQIIKIPVNEREYLLVENRNVDPDGDGATALFGTLDSRVVLYPTPFNDPNNNPSYEYDFMLPSFTKSDGSFIGGGLLAWLVNDTILYDEGYYEANGEFVSNFSNNSINTRYSRRGVQIIEADGLTDLGNDYSMYWTGTPYEYFHAHKPLLNSNGEFVSWANTPWKPSLNANTTPALVDSYGYPGLYGLSNISNPAKVMTLQLTSGFFDSTAIKSFNTPHLIPTDVINSGFNSLDIPVFHFGAINLISNIDGNWQDLMGNYHSSISLCSFPPQTVDTNDDGFPEICLTSDNNVHLLDFSDVQLVTHPLVFPSNITVTPLPYNSNLYVATESCIYKLHDFSVSNFISCANALKLSAFDNKLLVLGKDWLNVYDANTLQLLNHLSLSGTFGNIEPVTYQNVDKSVTYIYLMSDTGNLYRYDMVTCEQIFTNRTTDTPGQIAISKLGETSPVIFFGVGSTCYTLKADGSILPGFPQIASQSISLSLSPKSLYLLGEDYLFFPTANNAYLAFNEQGRVNNAYSLSFVGLSGTDFVHYAEAENELIWYYSDNAGNLYIHTMDNVTENPILYSGFRNGNGGNFTAPFTESVLQDSKFNAFVYPNPIKHDYCKLRVSNSHGEISLKIYDISGSLVYSKKLQSSLNNPQDIELDSLDLSSGVYILNLENNGNRKTLKLAVEK